MRRKRSITAIKRRLRDRVRNNTPTRAQRCALALDAVERFAGGASVSFLDAGTGDGMLAIAAARRHRDWRITAADVSASALQHARQRAADRGLTEIDFVEHDLTLPFDSGPFDCVVALECLSEIEDDAAAIGSLSAALRPGGLFVLNVPDESWAPVLRSSPRTWRHQVRHGYSPEAISSRLRAERLEPERVRTTMRGTVTLAQELRDRWKDGRLWRLALAYPALASATQLERLGLTWGPGRAIFITARRV